MSYLNIAVDSVEFSFYLVYAFDFESLCLHMVVRERSSSPSLLSYYVWWYMRGSYWVAHMPWTDSYVQAQLVGIFKIRIVDWIQFIYTWPNRSKLLYCAYLTNNFLVLLVLIWMIGHELSHVNEALEIREVKWVLWCVWDLFVDKPVCRIAEEDLVKFGTSVNYRVFVLSRFWNVNITQFESISRLSHGDGMLYLLLRQERKIVVPCCTLTVAIKRHEDLVVIRKCQLDFCCYSERRMEGDYLSPSCWNQLFIIRSRLIGRKEILRGVVSVNAEEWLCKS